MSRARKETAPLYSWYVAGVLLLVGISNQWSRYLLPYLYAASFSADAPSGHKRFVSINYALDLTPTQCAFARARSLRATRSRARDPPRRDRPAPARARARRYGLLAGYGFSVVYCLMSLVMGRAADRYNRKLIIVEGLVIWNAANAVRRDGQRARERPRAATARGLRACARARRVARLARSRSLGGRDEAEPETFAKPTETVL